MDLTYVRLVKNATPPGGLGDIPWQDDAVALICGICQLICSAYFAYSAYSVATKKKLLIVWYGLLMAVIFLSAFFRAILGLTPTDWSDGAHCGNALDSSSKAVPTPPLHTGSMPAPGSLLNHPSNAWVLQQQQAPLLSRLLTTILTSFSLTAILMFSLLCLVLAMHGTEFDPQLPKATGIFTALRLLATPTVSHNTNFGFQPPGLQVDLPATEVKHNWTQMLGTASTRSTRTRIGKDSMTKLYFPEAFRTFHPYLFERVRIRQNPDSPNHPHQFTSTNHNQDSCVKPNHLCRILIASTMVIYPAPAQSISA
ncbi:hypothetical protein Pst134EA_026766 [Puccinia striiformis f. sp. tritici]|uniref:hypothetical protein n=1 Tax=Puccinia striiformis f. sp. tritici TaxID=168172 RepID=UPI0020072816|nr:hypothetical protein Pst134EA_026766 [Puccinia striiformis f. sp. tritici]KAH9450054.1 hypothetical protein Pst134EA_026766 [Puccinia striiformis f. sp. tritici]